MIPSLDATLDFQGQALVLRAERQRLIASNIANADTPGYQARDFDFASALRAASGATRVGAGIAEGVTGSAGARHPTLHPSLRYALPAQTNLDRNTVDMDRERAAFADNAVKYEATLRFVGAGVRTALEAMKAPNQA